MKYHGIILISKIRFEKLQFENYNIYIYIHIYAYLLEMWEHENIKFLKFNLELNLQSKSDPQKNISRFKNIGNLNVLKLYLFTKLNFNKKKF